MAFIFYPLKSTRWASLPAVWSAVLRAWYTSPDTAFSQSHNAASERQFSCYSTSPLCWCHWLPTIPAGWFPPTGVCAEIWYDTLDDAHIIILNDIAICARTLYDCPVKYWTNHQIILSRAKSLLNLLQTMIKGHNLYRRYPGQKSDRLIQNFPTFHLKVLLHIQLPFGWPAQTNESPVDITVLKRSAELLLVVSRLKKIESDRKIIRRWFLELSAVHQSERSLTL